MNVKSNKKESKLKCISLKGELADWGKHIYFPEMGVTLCGCFTIHYDKEKFKNMPKNMVSTYKIEEWDITCEKCLQMMDIVAKGNEARKNIN